MVQNSAGLGAALRFGFQEAAARGLPYAVAVSADSPTLPADRVSKAASALRAGRAVLGPTGDGGYYLIGRPLPASEGILDRLFQATPMGGSDVLRRTLAAIPGAVVLEPWTDVDTSAELMELAAELTASPAAVPATAAWLKGQSWGERRRTHR